MEKTIVLSEVRRRDRAVTDEEWLEAYLEGAEMGTLAFEAGNELHLQLNTFAYDRPARALYFHAARTGQIGTAMAHGPFCASFVTGESGRYLPATEAAKFSVEYQSVVVRGQLTLVQGEAARPPLSLLLEKYFPHLRQGVDYQTITAEELHRTAVYRLDVEAWSGKRKAEAADFPGAFRYAERQR